MGGTIHAGTNTVMNCTFHATCRSLGLKSGVMHLTCPSMTLVYDSDRSKDAMTLRPRYNSLNQYSLSNMKERWGDETPRPHKPGTSTMRNCHCAAKAPRNATAPPGPGSPAPAHCAARAPRFSELACEPGPCCGTIESSPLTTHFCTKNADTLRRHSEHQHIFVTKTLTLRHRRVFATKCQHTARTLAPHLQRPGTGRQAELAPALLRGGFGTSTSLAPVPASNVARETW